MEPCGQRLSRLDHHGYQLTRNVRRQLNDLFRSDALHDEARQVGTRPEIRSFLRSLDLQGDLVHGPVGSF